jgi:dihydrofolate reductase
MSKVVLVMYVSLDGVVENPSWTVPYWNDELAAYQRDQLFASDALLLGRVTYEEFAAAWPTMTEEGDFGQRMNSLPKYVATNTLKALEWNATAIEGDVVDPVAKMREQPGGDLLIYGSADLVGTLMAHSMSGWRADSSWFTPHTPASETPTPAASRSSATTRKPRSSGRTSSTPTATSATRT